MVERNVDRIRGQVMNILYYAKEREPNWERVRAEDVGREAFKIITAKAAELSVTLVDRIGVTGEFDADPQAVRSLLVNLLENSLDACRVDSKKIAHQVVFEVNGDEKAVHFAVEDNGIGMDRETREKGAKGTGLGLFIANKIAKAHGGNIALTSELDKGSRFVVSLPRQRNAEGNA
jgi:signal transduction histidine kinase